ncbi:MAG: thiamine phosphate synthase [Acidobacteria bacterium]|nr:thiamine phosphate synthase [Acidobacteriota bacterium]
MALCYYITARCQLRTLPAVGNPEKALKEKVRAAFSAGVDYVQVREKDLPDEQLTGLVEELQSLPEINSTRLLVNGRLDIAITCGADGVHLPSDSLPLPAVRRGARKLIVGISCHSVEEVEQAGRQEASYALLGPIFDTPSKPAAKSLGLAAFAQGCRRASIPVFALGGVDLSNAPACIQAGAAGLAGIRLFQQAQNLEEVCHQLHAL